ncbi:MAG: hypothetical protein KDN19_23380 [Verrucomicrobiae bacterium]|nr:hypothetical protein [Verrucomicrobiae bacterium]
MNDRSHRFELSRRFAIAFAAISLSLASHPASAANTNANGNGNGNGNGNAYAYGKNKKTTPEGQQLAAVIASDAGGTSEQYSDYAEKLAITLSRLSDEQKARIFAN